MPTLQNPEPSRLTTLNTSDANLSPPGNGNSAAAVGAGSYCGAALEVPSQSRITARTNPWDLESYLDRIFRAAITLPAADLAERRDFFLDAAQTEFDAEFLCRHLETSGVSWTPEFVAFEKEWRRDEYRHYVGFRRLHARLYPDTGEGVLTAIIENVVPDFGPIQGFLRDEFNVLTAIAFDEACTSKSYADELPFYARLGDVVFAEWIRHLAHDEANHLRNALAVIRTRHAARWPEFPGLLDRFLAHDSSGARYRNTFLFDHEAYAPEFVARVVARLKTQVADKN